MGVSATKLCGGDGLSRWLIIRKVGGGWAGRIGNCDGGVCSVGVVPAIEATAESSTSASDSIEAVFT